LDVPGTVPSGSDEHGFTIVTFVPVLSSCWQDDKQSEISLDHLGTSSFSSAMMLLLLVTSAFNRRLIVVVVVDVVDVVVSQIPNQPSQYKGLFLDDVRSTYL
jgi:hypothetical protein